MNRSIDENRMVGSPMHVTRHSVGMIEFGMNMNEWEGKDPKNQPDPKYNLMHVVHLIPLPHLIGSSDPIIETTTY